MRPRFEPDPNQPVYVYMQLADFLTARIEDGMLPPGAMLPCGRNLAAEHRVAVGTARRAIQVLRERGLVVTLPNRGSFVLRQGHDGRGRPRR